MKRILRAIIALCMCFILYTLYCVFSERDLCDLKKVNPKTTAFMELKKEEWQEKKLKRSIIQHWVPLSSISHNLKNAVIVAEDPNFYHHHGLDFHAMWMAFQKNIEDHRIVYGASTITQQLMKNMYLSPSRNPFRKWHEAILTVRVERCVPKNRILEVYLNVIEWGDSIYGIEAAARRYFGKSASALNPAESALLAAMIPNPNYYNPYKRNPKLIKDKNSILRSMLALGMINKEEYEQAINEHIQLR